MIVLFVCFRGRFELCEIYYIVYFIVFMCMSVFYVVVCMWCVCVYGCNSTSILVLTMLPYLLPSPIRTPTQVANTRDYKLLVAWLVPQWNISFFAVQKSHTSAAGADDMSPHAQLKESHHFLFPLYYSQLTEGGDRTRLSLLWLAHPALALYQHIRSSQKTVDFVLLLYYYANDSR